MSKPSTLRVPSYRRHKSSGQAVVTINSRDIYLGKWNSAASKAEYDRLVAESLTHGRQLQSNSDRTVVEVLNAYRKFAESYYRKDGRVTSEYNGIKDALKLVREFYGRVSANEFGPLALKAVRQRMIDKGWSRSTINKAISRIRRCFKWAVENGLVRNDMYHGLMAVSGLRMGRSDAREAEPVLPVDDVTVEVTLPHLTPPRTKHTRERVRESAFDVSSLPSTVSRFRDWNVRCCSIMQILNAGSTAQQLGKLGREFAERF
ncbi:phage integrase SAM-like domain-containing protein [Thalassoglobus polymorphus]|uniref:Core-binding (CB) domain-containing protein n=1 Tax=Thalassoglobus polymorphus TaxID=2527994 RepID=A0A517QQQ3_9PLAN|nr:phage integrase SAM-like domain-containing protein [Thalassoglobus polymorphus]QDT33925.1 hypothetical protein Mal48_31820 [Thalassoglobus polymorphus]